MVIDVRVAPRRAADRWARALRESPGALPGGLVLAIIVYWAARDGGFDPLHWLPGTLFLLVLFAIVAVTARPVVVPRSAAVALAALLGFTIWSFLSMTWAGVPADAWLGADKTVLYLCVFALFVLLPWKAMGAAIAIGGFSLAIAVLGVTTIVRASVASAPIDFFIGGKLIAPITYANANVALYLMALFPALYLSMRREVHPLLRGIFLAAAGVLPQVALIVQSRTSLAAMPLTLAAFFALVPGRARSFVALVPVAVAAAASSATMIDVYGPAVSGHGVREALVAARSALVLSAAILFAVGLGLAVLDRRIDVPQPVARRIKLAVAGVATLLILSVCAVTVTAYGVPWRHVDEWAREFRTEKEPVYSPDTPYLSSGLGGGRYDLWRVAWVLFREHPVTGVGVDNFGVENALRRKQLTDSAYPHSIELRTLSQTGVIGGALLVAFFVASALGVASALRNAPAYSAGVAGAAASAALYWLVHGSAEWFWEMPALSATAFAFVGIAIRLGDDTATESSLRVSRSLLVGAGAAAVVVSVFLVPPWLAARDVDAAVRGWRADPSDAFDRLDRARALNPLSDAADVMAGVIAGQIGDPVRERAAFERAIGRNPDNWYPYMELGVLDARAGRRASALERLARARSLNPLEPVLIIVQGWLRDGDIPTRSELDRLLLSRASNVQAGAR